MKTEKLIFASLISLAIETNAQQFIGGPMPNPLYTSSSVRIGGSSAPSSGTTFHVGSGSASLHWNNGSGGMIIKASAGDRALLELHDPSSTNRTVLQSLSYGTYLSSGVNIPLFLNSGAGNVGVNTINPQEKLSVETSALNDGISVNQIGTGASAVHMYNSTGGGNHWALFSTGAGNTQGSGNFSIYQYGVNDRLLINGATGNVGIATSAPSYKLHVESDDGGMANNPMAQNGYFPPTHSGGYFKYTGINKVGAHTALQGHNLNNAPGSGGDVIHGVGVFGKSERTAEGWANTQCVGVQGHASNGLFNFGGLFFGDNGYIYLRSSEAQNEGEATSIGVWASASGNNATAGYFNGKTYSHEFYQNADAKMQNNIKPLTKAIDKLKLIQAKSFNFSSSDHANMNLPEGEQMGLNAEEVEKIFPGLVKEFKDFSSTVREDKSGKVTAFKGINYSNFIPLLISGIQEQQTQMENQANTIAAQQKQLDEQKQLISDLSQKTTGTNFQNTIGSVEAGFQMSQNEPNPFTHETLVRYTLPASVVNAYMAVYDLTGKQISTFSIHEKGSSSITITSEKLAAGIYIYSIVADGKVVDSKKMIIAGK